MGINLRIKEIRLLMGMNMKEFSSVINIDNSQYSKIEQGKLMPTIPQLVEISSNFRVSLNWLIREIGDMYLLEGQKGVSKVSPYVLSDHSDAIAAEPDCEYLSVKVLQESQIKDLNEQIKLLKDMLKEKQQIISEKDAIIRDKNEIIEVIKKGR